MIPRVGEQIRQGTPYRHRPGAYAILEREGQVLLTHQSEPVPEYQLPGGGIDPGEHILPALHREIYEETGWRVSSLRRLGAFRRFTYMPEYSLWAEKLCHIYLGRPCRSLGPPTEPHHSALWVPADIAASLVANEGDRLFLSRLYGV